MRLCFLTDHFIYLFFVAGSFHIDNKRELLNEIDYRCACLSSKIPRNFIFGDIFYAIVFRAFVSVFVGFLSTRIIAQVCIKRGHIERLFKHKMTNKMTNYKNYWEWSI